MQRTYACITACKSTYKLEISRLNTNEILLIFFVPLISHSLVKSKKNPPINKDRGIPNLFKRIKL
jgi:hypothetical protein